MRVYSRGKKVPMDKVDWALLCRSGTTVTREDPEVVWPERIKKAREKALRELIAFLGDSSKTEGLLSKIYRWLYG